jgi:hypothetical protein
MANLVFPQEPNWDDFHGEDPPKLAAELRDVDGRVVSKGEAMLFGEKTPSFYPRDAASQATILANAKILFLTEDKKSLTILNPNPAHRGSFTSIY